MKREKRMEDKKREKKNRNISWYMCGMPRYEKIMHQNRERKEEEVRYLRKNGLVRGMKCEKRGTKRRKDNLG